MGSLTAEDEQKIAYTERPSNAKTIQDALVTLSVNTLIFDSAHTTGPSASDNSTKEATPEIVSKRKIPLPKSETFSPFYFGLRTNSMADIFHNRKLFEVIPETKCKQSKLSEEDESIRCSVNDFMNFISKTKNYDAIVCLDCFVYNFNPSFHTALNISMANRTKG